MFWIALFVVLFGMVIWRRLSRWMKREKVKTAYLGKTVWVTGASQGLGRSLVKELHKVKAKKIIASARNLAALEELALECEGGRVIPVALDLSNESDIMTKVRLVQKTHGPIDVLINNGGISCRATCLESSMEVERRVMEVNYFGTIALTKALLPHLIQSHSPTTIAVISSLQGKIGLPFRGAYSASKHALQGYFDALRHEVKSFNIGITILNLGYVQTQLSVNAVTADGSSYAKMDATQESGMPADQAARIVLEDIASGDWETYICKFSHSLAVYLRLLTPALLFSIVQNRSKKELVDFAARLTTTKKEK